MDEKPRPVTVIYFQKKCTCGRDMFKAGNYYYWWYECGYCLRRYGQFAYEGR